MTMTVATNQDGDNSELSVITNSESATPSVALAPNVSDANGWNWGMCTFDGCLGLTPVFNWPAATFDSARSLANIVAYYSYDQITWTAFDNNATPGDLVSSNGSAFAGDKVQVAHGRPYTWTKMRDLMDNTWGPHAWVSQTASGDSNFVMWTSPADTDRTSAARTIPAQDACGFKIAHPDFIGTIRRKLVIMCGNHVAEYMGHELLVQFVDQLLNAVEDSATDKYAYAYEVLRYYDVYCYPMINSCGYVSPNRKYDGLLAGSGYDFGSQWDNPDAEVQAPFRALIETDINSSADAVIDFHSTTGSSTAETYYQITTNADTLNGDDSVWFGLYGTHRYWYQFFMLEIIGTTQLRSSDNEGAIRQYGRGNWGATIGTTIEIGQAGTKTLSDSDNAAKATMHMLNQMVREGRTSIPRKNAPQGLVS